MPRLSSHRAGGRQSAESGRYSDGAIGSGLITALVAMVGIPLFVMVNPSGSVGLPTGTSVEERAGSLAVPVSVLCMGALLLLTPAAKRRSSRSLAVGALIIFVVANVISFLVGVLVFGFSFLSVAFFGQTFLPLLGFVIGRRLGSFDGEWLSRALLLLATLTLVAFGGIALTTLLAGGAPWSYVGESLGPIQIPQARRYLPTVVAFALILYCRAHFARKLSIWRGLAVFVVLIFIAAAHSRTVLVILGVALLLFLAVDVRVRASGRIKMTLIAIVGGILLWMAWSSADPASVPEALSRFSSEDAAAQLSSDRRSEALVESLTETAISPLGRLYQATEDKSLGGVDAAYARVSNAENQLGEFGLRAGPVALIAMIVAIGSVLRNSRSAIKEAAESEPVIEGLWLATFATIVGSVFTQQSLSQPYTGTALFFGLGILLAWSQRARPVKVGE